MAQWVTQADVGCEKIPLQLMCTASDVAASPEGPIIAPQVPLSPRPFSQGRDAQTVRGPCGSGAWQSPG